MVVRVDGAMLAFRNKRDRTMPVYLFFMVVLGMEYTMNITSLWIYINTLMDTTQPTLYYALIPASFYICSISTALTICRLFDRVRRARLILCLASVCGLVGNIVYTLHFHPMVVLAGRSLSAMVTVAKPIINAEVARSFSGEELTKAYSKTAIALYFGAIAGGAINFAFFDIDITIGLWRITYANFVGIFMAALIALIIVLIYFFVYDLSREYDLKAENMREELVAREINTDNINTDTTDEQLGTIDEKEPLVSNNALEEKETATEDDMLERKKMITKGGVINKDAIKNELINADIIPSIPVIMRVICTNTGLCYLTVCSFITQAIMKFYQYWLSLIVVEVMGWGFIELNIVQFGQVVICIALMVYLWARPPSNNGLFNIGLLGFFLFIVLSIDIVLLVHLDSSLPVQIAKWVVFTVALSFEGLLDALFLQKLMATMIPSSVQSFCDSLRMVVGRIGSIVGILLSGVLFPYTMYVCSVFVIVLGSCIAFLLVHRRIFKNPKIVDFNP